MEIKNEIIKRIAQQIDKQNAKGVARYGATLESCEYHAHDWQQMIIEELIDALQYQQKEILYLYEINRQYTQCITLGCAGIGGAEEFGK